jgi:hypothetical protein
MEPYNPNFGASWQDERWAEAAQNSQQYAQNPTAGSSQHTGNHFNLSADQNTYGGQSANSGYHNTGYHESSLSDSQESVSEHDPRREIRDLLARTQNPEVRFGQTELQHFLTNAHEIVERQGDLRPSDRNRDILNQLAQDIRAARKRVDAGRYSATSSGMVQDLHDLVQDLHNQRITGHERNIHKETLKQLNVLRDTISRNSRGRQVSRRVGNALRENHGPVRSLVQGFFGIFR